MSGAYVAKPAVEPTAVPPAPDVPDDWNTEWPFPGMTNTEWPGIDPDPFFPAPHPPGYEPDYSLVMTATEEIAPDGAAAVTGSLRDHDTFATNEPTAVIWTATITSSPTRVVNLRFSGDEEYASGISSDCAFETYWGVSPNIEFELTEEDDGGTVTLTGASSIGGVAVTQTKEITVSASTSATLTMVWSTPTGITPNEDEEDLPEEKFAAWLEIYDEGWAVISSRQIIYVQTSVAPSYQWQVDYEEDDDSVEVTVTSNSIVMEIADILLPNSGNDFRVFLRITSSGGGCNSTATVELEIDEETTDLSLAVSLIPEVTGDYHDPWVTINAETGEVTVNNP